MTHFLWTILFGLLGVSDPGAIRRVTDWQWYAAAPAGLWLTLTLVLLGVAAAGMNLLPRAGIPWGTRLTLLLLRLAGFAVLALLLVQIEVCVNLERALKPNVAVITDTSGSMGMKDVQGKTRLAAGLDFRKKLLAELDGRASVARYSLDWTLHADDGAAAPDASGMTRIMDGLRELMSKERNLQAAILITDGNDTGGDRGAAVAPLLAARGLPVYPVTFGQPDLSRPPQVRFKGGGDYVRLGEELRLDATLAAAQFQGQTVRAQLFEEGVTQPVAPPQEGIRLGEKPTALSFTIRPERAGRHVYRIVIDGIKGGASDRLLAAEQAVDVVDRKIRVLYVDIPRDERKLLGEWLARDPVVDLATLTLLPKGGWYAQGQMRHQNLGTGLPDQESDLNEYDVIILGDIPRSVFRSGDPSETKLLWLVDFVKRRGGGLLTLGGASVYAAGQYQDSVLGGILPFTIERTRDPQIKGRFRVEPVPMAFSHPAMLLENDFEGNRTAWFGLPQVEGCNRVGALKPGATLLAVRRLPDGPMPVMACQNVGKGRVLALAVDTTWRWEMLRPRGSDTDGTPEGPDYYRRFWGNAVRFLAPDPRLEPDRPQITLRSSGAEVGQTVVLATRLVDRVFKPVRKADLTIHVTSPSGRKQRIFPSDGRSQPGVYEYPVSLDEAGVWRVEAVHNEKEVLDAQAKAEKALAKAKTGDDKAVVAQAQRDLDAVKARIAVEEIRAGESVTELEDPRARPDVMAAFAQATGGQAFQPAEWGKLAQALQLRANTVTQHYAIALWNLPFMMVLFILLVGLDCLVRKRRGLV